MDRHPTGFWNVIVTTGSVIGITAGAVRWVVKEWKVIRTMDRIRNHAAKEESEDDDVAQK